MYFYHIIKPTIFVITMSSETKKSINGFVSLCKYPITNPIVIKNTIKPENYKITLKISKKKLIMFKMYLKHFKI